MEIVEEGRRCVFTTKERGKLMKGQLLKEKGQLTKERGQLDKGKGSTDEGKGLTISHF